MILDTLATVLMSPLLLVQAIHLHKRALRLPEAAGARHGIQGTGPSLRILIVGDSSAAGVGAPTQELALTGQLASALASERCVEWHLIAQTGATTPSTLARLHREALPAVDIVVVVLGVNDVTRGGAMSRWLHQCNSLRGLLRDHTGATHLYISQVPPLGAFPLLPRPLRWVLGRRATRFDAALHTALKAEPDVTYVPLPAMLEVSDMAEDGFHPGPVIYAAWAKEMARRILSDGPKQ